MQGNVARLIWLAYYGKPFFRSGRLSSGTRGPGPVVTNVAYEEKRILLFSTEISQNSTADCMVWNLLCTCEKMARYGQRPENALKRANGTCDYSVTRYDMADSYLIWILKIPLSHFTRISHNPWLFHLTVYFHDLLVSRRKWRSLFVAEHSVARPPDFLKTSILPNHMHLERNKLCKILRVLNSSKRYATITSETQRFIFAYDLFFRINLYRIKSFNIYRLFVRTSEHL